MLSYFGHNVFPTASMKGRELTTSIRPSATPMEINYDVVNASHFHPANPWPARKDRFTKKLPGMLAGIYFYMVKQSMTGSI